MEAKNPFFRLYFFNKDSSVTIIVKSLTFSGIVLRIGFEGSVSQIFFYLSHSLFFMLC